MSAGGEGGGVRAGSYRADVDGLRSVAVVAVVLYHLQEGPEEAWLPGGFTGVDIFFCISGYVVAGSLLRRPADIAAGPRHLLAGFYARRTKRLAPALLVVAVLTALTAALFIDPAQPALRSYFDTGLLGLVGLSNNLLTSLRRWTPPSGVQGGTNSAAVPGSAGGSQASLEDLEGNPYFSHLFSAEGAASSAGNPTTAEPGTAPPPSLPPSPPPLRSELEHHYNPFTHTWSLGVEEQFYLIFPLLFLLAYRSGGGPGRPAGLFGGLAAFGLAAGWVTTHFDRTHAFYLMPARLWELLCGCALLAAQDWMERLADGGAAGAQGTASTGDSSSGLGGENALSYAEGGAAEVQDEVQAVLTEGGEADDRAGRVGGGVAALPLWAVAALDLGSAASLVGALVCSQASQFPLPWAILPVGGTLLFIAAGSGGSRRLGRAPVPLLNHALSAPVPVYLGNISYPLYLWHWPVFTLFRWTVGLEGKYEKVGALALSFAGAVATYHTVERVARRWKPRRAWHVFRVLLPLTALAALLLGLLREPLYGKLFLGAGSSWERPKVCAEPAAVWGAFAERARGTCGCRGCCVTLHASPSCYDSEVSGPNEQPCFQPAAGSTVMDGGALILFSGPTSTMVQSAPLGQCFLLRKREQETGGGALTSYEAPVRACLSPGRGDGGGPAAWPPPYDGLPDLRGPVPTDSLGRQPVVFLVGDSHAASLAASLTEASAEKFGFVWVAAQCGCSFGPRTNWERLLLPHCGDSTEEDCAIFNTAAQVALEENLREGDVLAVFNGAWKLDDGLVAAIQAEGRIQRSMIGPAGNLTNTVDEAVLAREEAFLTRLSDIAGSRGASLLLLGDWPLHPAPGVECARPQTGAFGDSCGVLFTDGRRQWQAVADMLEGLAAERPHVHFFSLWDRLCDPVERKCSALVPGTNALAFFDEDHLTVDGARFLAPHLCSFLYGAGLLAPPAP